MGINGADTIGREHQEAAESPSQALRGASPSNHAEDVLNNYQSMSGSASDRPDGYDTSYRGFHTSINDMFADPKYERVDCCAMACCGVLQNDRDRYLVTGVKPPSLCKRFWIHTVLPIATFLAAGYCAFRVKDPYLNQALCTSLVVLLIGAFFMQCFKGAWKRQYIRRELLFEKHQLITTGRVHLRHDDLSINDIPGESLPGYYMGQTRYDIRNAHTLLCCYATDQPRSGGDEEQRQEKENLCGCLFRWWTKACCGVLCGMHLQVCGICGVAQEARQIEEMYDAHERRIDYITMQPFLDYYPAIYQMRTSTSLRRSFFGVFGGSGSSEDDQHTVDLLFGLSTFSRGSVGMVIGIIFCLFVWSLISSRFHFEFGIGNYAVFLATLLQSLVYLMAVYWWHMKDVSGDALIKFFASGFLLSTTLAVFYELSMGLAVRFVMSLLMAMSGIDEVDSNGFTGPMFAGTSPNFGRAMSLLEKSDTQSYRDYLSVFGDGHPIIYTLYLFVNAFLMAALVEELCKYFGFRMAAYHPDFLSKAEIEEAAEAYNEEGVEQEDLRHPMNLTFAEQDRSMLSRGAAVTVSMVAVALGFACCENLVYIFIYGESTVGMQALVLAARSLFPVHPIAAAIQSIGVCKRDLEHNKSMKLGRIVFAAILFHGTYDFLIVWIDFLVSRNGNYVVAGDDDESLSDTDSIENVYALFSSFGVLACGLFYYFREAKLQHQRLAAMDEDAAATQSHVT